AAWDTTQGSDQVIVAVIDSGILSKHPDLVGKIVPGYDFVRASGNSGDGDGLDSNPEDKGEAPYHGTLVAGIVAASTDTGLGVAGVGWKTRVMPVRAIGVDGSGTSYDILQAVQYAAGMANDSGHVPTRSADIINLSLGGKSSSAVEQSVFTAVRSKGIFV